MFSVALGVKGALLDTETPEVVTVIGPVAAPDGTETTSCVDVAESTAAFTPLNVTVFDAGVAEKPVPLRMTWLLAVPVSGVKAISASWVEG